MHFSKVVLFCTAFAIYGQGAKLRARNELAEREMYSVIEAHLERRLNELEYPYIAQRTDDSRPLSHKEQRKQKKEPPAVKQKADDADTRNAKKSQRQGWKDEQKQKQAEIEEEQKRRAAINAKKAGGGGAAAA